MPAAKDAATRTAEVVEAYAGLRRLGVLADAELSGFRAACQGYVRSGEAASGRLLVARLGRELRYDLRPAAGRPTTVVLLAGPPGRPGALPSGPAGQRASGPAGRPGSGAGLPAV